AAPTTATIIIISGDITNIDDILDIRYTPEVTIVAACINAETEVGPAIASGSQRNNGICALLPVAPISISMPIMNLLSAGKASRMLKKSAKIRHTKWTKAINKAIRKAKSPIRLKQKTLTAATILYMSEYQKTITR